MLNALEKDTSDGVEYLQFDYDPDRDKAIEVSRDTVGWGADASEVVVASGEKIVLRKIPPIP